MGNEEIKLARKETHSRGLALTGGNRVVAREEYGVKQFFLRWVSINRSLM